MLRSRLNQDTAVAKLEKFPSKSGWNAVRIPAGVDSDNCWFNLKAAQGEINSVPFALSSSEPTNSVIGPEAVETTTASTASSSDVEESATSTTLTAASTTLSNEPQSSPAQEKEEDEDPEGQEPKGLSTSVKVGLAAGISLGVIGAAVLITIVANLRKREKTNGAKGTGPHHGSIDTIQGHQMTVHPGSHSPVAQSNLAYWCHGNKAQYTFESQATPRYELP